MDPIKGFIHQLNAEAFKVNKNLVGKTDSLKEIPLDKTIYSKTPQTARPPVQPQPIQQQVTQQVASEIIPGPAVNNEQIEKFIKQLTSVEKKIDRFFNLIEKRVVKNAKEINIRIKLNEDSNTEQE